MTIEKKTKLIKLFSMYQVLLTQKQQTYFKAYVEEDFSLKEVADAFQVTRSAVHDQIQKIEQYLVSYEEKLHLLRDSEKRIDLLNQYEHTLDKKCLDELRKMDE